MVSDDDSGSCLLVALPEDALLIVNQFLSHKDVFNLGTCCRTLHGLASSDEIWIFHCERIEILLHKDLVEWRKGFASYKALFRFLASVHPLIGIWVHRNPELGNVVYVMPGFLSVVGCRIVPQELGPLGMAGGPIIKWAPVFEIIADFDGSTIFFLHGREGDDDYLCHGSFKPGDRTRNVLSLEVDPRKLNNVGNQFGTEPISHPDYGISVPFTRLSCFDRTILLEIATSQNCFRKVPGSTSGTFFPCSRSDEDSFQQDMVLLSERRSILKSLYKDQGGGSREIRTSVGLTLESFKIEHSQVRAFLGSADSIGLNLHYSTMELCWKNGWPSGNERHFGLCKLPVQSPKNGQEYAGLWGGTYGWPPGRPGEALFFLLLSYEEFEGKQLLKATKILEGSRYTDHPNGSTMFTVYPDEEVSGHPFPWDTDVVVLDAFPGEGIASGYVFCYPGSKPGSLFVIEGGLLAFVWEESEDVLTLKKLDLTELLKKGEQVPALSPVSNFSYLTRSHSNVYSNTSNMT